jgi:hypothetical protein
MGLIKKEGISYIARIMGESALSFFRDQVATQADAEERSAWACEGQSPCLKNKADCDNLLWFSGDHVDQLYIFSEKQWTPSTLPRPARCWLGSCERKGLSSSSVFLHLDNAPIHSVKLAKECIKKRGVRMLEHAPYSPNLALYDVSLFPKL